MFLELLLLPQPHHKYTKFFFFKVAREEARGGKNWDLHLLLQCLCKCRYKFTTIIKEGISELTTQLAGRNAHETKCQGIYYIFIPVVNARRGQGKRTKRLLDPRLESLSFPAIRIKTISYSPHKYGQSGDIAPWNVFIIIYPEIEIDRIPCVAAVPS